MALIGNQLSSAENNSYRVLDNLASFTLTFDGSSSSNVLASTDTIALSQHPFVTGQRVTYSSGGGSPIGGLLSGTAYYITKTDQNSFQLATSYVNAITNVVIDLVGPGTGVTHSFNVAFDGINTKFKATYSNGTKCTISRAPQLDIAINGVVQQPYDSNPPPNGFTIEADATIVFSTAPLAGYTFWGKALSGATASFETSDNSIDNFTGNGSTTNFTLSKTPANSQNVLVTINGVTQYPSDATGTRSYSTNANVLVFTAAPANGSLIQVRYIGFAGPTSSNVTGFYGRTGNVVLNSSDGIGVGTAKIGTGIVGLATALLVEGNTRLNGITTITSSTGLSTVTVGGATTALLVQGNARITGILTIGTSSITFDGNTDTISARTVSTGSTVSIGASTIVVGNIFIGNNSIGLGATTTTGRNAGINTASGSLIYNSSINDVQVYKSDISGWSNIAGKYIEAGGGTISDYTLGSITYRSHTFTGSGIFNVTSAQSDAVVEYLVVAGGGGGGNGPAVGGGGGGAGGLLYNSSYPIVTGTYTISIGAGGAGLPSAGTANPGVPSFILSSNPGISSITAIGGGGGGGFFPGNPTSADGKVGGSGGGGGGTESGTARPGGSGISGQGTPGGYGVHNPGVYAAFGGGGGAARGGTPNNVNPGYSGGPGGSGWSFTVTGSSVTYAGGGAGGGYGPAASGGAGGGGNGGGNVGTQATGGGTNTGGGGGGNFHPAGAGSASGGSGIVVIRYQTGQLPVKAIGGTVSYTATKTIHTFLSSATFRVTSPSLTSVDYFVVAGGGGGGGTIAGGGGAGAVRYATSSPVSLGSYVVSVGAGGRGGDADLSINAANGSDSSFGPLSAAGGGAGSPNYGSTGIPGGSGGGGGRAPGPGGAIQPGGTASGAAGGAGDTTSPASGWGNPGGTGSNTGGGDNFGSGGGGGGAGSAGGNASGGTGGSGGNGLAFTISGTTLTYAGGGGGSAYNGTGGSGGPGGGGAGGAGNGPISTFGAQNTGSGGGAGGYPAFRFGSNGGSGIVIIAYPS